MSGRKNIPVVQMIETHLKKHGFDGLYSNHECACVIGAIAPCENLGKDCMPGYRQPCDCGDHDWHIGPKRPRKARKP